MIWFLRICFIMFLLRTSASANAAEVQLDSSHPTPAASFTSPLDFQVFQRSSRLQGTILVRGEAHQHVDEAEARIIGNSLSGPLDSKWRHLSVNSESGTITADLLVNAGGFYRIEIKLLSLHKAIADMAIQHVGVGEVFVISGQSNATNYGEERQRTETGEVASFSGASWRLADDPQPGVQDHSTGGSFVPSFGDALYRRYHVPIGIASVGYGATSVRQWLPAGERMEEPPTMADFVTRSANGTLTSDGTLFDGMMTRINQFGPHGFRALLWHQGESDANQQPGRQISPKEYRRMMELIIRTSRERAGWDFPWFVAEATYHTPSDPSSPSIREAQRSLWHANVAFEGPDTDALTARYRQNKGQGVHFNALGLRTHGLLWATAVETYLDRELQ